MNRIIIFLGGALAFTTADHLLADEPKFDWTISPLTNLPAKPTLTPTLTFSRSDGRQAIIDFSGPAIQYSGDLSVDESAKTFFDAVGGHLRTSCLK